VNLSLTLRAPLQHDSSLNPELSMTSPGPLPQRRLSLSICRPRDKTSRTPAQQKLASALLRKIDIDKDGRALVDVRAPITPQLQDKIRMLKGTVVSTSARYDSTIAWIPVLQLEALAEDPAVVSIIAATKPLTNPKNTGHSG
jgi:hypothetical protein